MTSRPQARNLKFNMQPSSMLAKADLFHDSAVDNVSELGAVDPTITTPYLASMATIIADARSHRTPLQARGDLKEATENVKTEMEDSFNAYQELLFYVKKAFPGNENKLEQFGSKSYLKARGSTKDMLTLMDLAKTEITPNTTELEAAGYTTAKITAFGTLFAALHANYQTQQTTKLGNLDTTDDYYEKMNNVWDNMVVLHDAAMIAFKDYYPLYKLFLLYDSPTGEMEFTLTIPAGGTVFHHFMEVLDGTQTLHFKMLSGSGSANICFAMDDGGACSGTPQALAQGAETDFLYSAFGGLGEYLRINQTGPIEMKVRVGVPGM